MATVCRTDEELEADERDPLNDAVVTDAKVGMQWGAIAILICVLLGLAFKMA